MNRTSATNHERAPQGLIHGRQSDGKLETVQVRAHLPRQGWCAVDRYRNVTRSGHRMAQQGRETRYGSAVICAATVQMQGVCREPTAYLPIAGQGYSMAYSIRPLEPGFEARKAHNTRLVWWRYPLVRRGHKTDYPLHFSWGFIRCKAWALRCMRHCRNGVMSLMSGNNASVALFGGIVPD